MQWNPQQETALKEFGRWFKDPNKQQVFRLFGYAGTGKTTLAMELASMAKREAFCAYTNRAALRMRQKGCVGADTFHALAYLSKQKSKQKYRDLVKELDDLKADLKKMFSDDELKTHPDVIKLNHEVEAERARSSMPSFSIHPESKLKHCDLIVLDEASMINAFHGENLLSFEVPVLILGDPFQLPPPKGSGYFTNHKANVLLTQVMRHDSAILEIATKIRKGERLRPGTYGADNEVTVLYKKDINRQEMLDCDQIIAGTHKKRRGINKRIRQLRGYESLIPEVGEKLVCLKNNKRSGLANGSMWTVEETDEHWEPGIEIATLLLRSMDDPEIIKEANATVTPFEYRDLKVWEHNKDIDEFDFGHAITCHKAQGSEWDHVVTFDESGCFHQNAQRWLYTAVTRAAEKQTIILD